MHPALHSGDRLAVDRTFAANDIKRGDIVVARVWKPGRDPSGASAGRFARSRFPRAGARGTQLIVKRVIALPGETVEVRDQSVAINHTRRIREPWARWGTDDSTAGPIQLDEDEVWVMGDVRDASRDSRAVGPVPVSALVGRGRLRIWPPGRIGHP